VVQVNQTFTGRTGMTITIQEATTWLPAPQFWSGWLGWVRVVGLRVVVDDRQAKANGTKLENWPPANDPVSHIFKVITADYRHSTSCYGLYLDKDPAGEASDLAAIGGDVAFSFDEATGIGEGWIICGTIPPQDSLFGPQYVVNVEWPFGTAADGSSVSDPLRFVVVEQ